MVALDLNLLTTSILTALIIGAFVSVENWFMQKHVFKNLEVIAAKIKSNGNGKPQEGEKEE